MRQISGLAPQINKTEHTTSSTAGVVVGDIAPPAHLDEIKEAITNVCKFVAKLRAHCDAALNKGIDAAPNEQ